MQIPEIIISELITITLIGSLLAFFIVLFCFNYNKKQIKQKEFFDKELLIVRLEVQEKTFQRISEELHDNIGQLLGLAKLNLFKWEMEQKSENIIISEAIKVIEQSIGELRSFALNLNANFILHNCLFDMVEKFINQLNNTQQFKINLSLQGKITNLRNDIEIMIFRIIQEAFHNIIKHSNADIVSVSFEYTPNALILDIQDNGIGFDVDEVLNKGYDTGSSGLQNIVRRIKFIGAHHKLISNQNKGTQICITIPI